MAIYGPTPADWAMQQQGRRDDQIRQMMSMVMASKQWQEEQRRYQDTLGQRDYQNALDLAKTQAYIQNVTEPNQVQPTEMMRNWQFLEGQYPGQDVGPMIVPGMRERQGSEFEYDLDPASQDELERWKGLPRGSVARMSPRVREDLHGAYLRTEYPTTEPRPRQFEVLREQQKAFLDKAVESWGRDIEQLRDDRGEMGAPPDPRIIDKNDKNRVIDNPKYQIFADVDKKIANSERVRARLIELRAKAGVSGLTDQEYQEAIALYGQTAEGRKGGPGFAAPKTSWEVGDVVEVNGKQLVLKTTEKGYQWLPLK